MVDQFTARRDPAVLVSQIQAGGVGLNIQVFADVQDVHVGDAEAGFESDVKTPPGGWPGGVWWSRCRGGGQSVVVSSVMAVRAEDSSAMVLPLV
jgi:hypothetical protein